MTSPEGATYKALYEPKVFTYHPGYHQHYSGDVRRSYEPGGPGGYRAPVPAKAKAPAGPAKEVSLGMRLIGIAAGIAIVYAVLKNDEKHKNKKVVHVAPVAKKTGGFFFRN